MKSLKSIIALFTAVIFVIMLGCDTGSVSETTEEQWSHDGRVGFFYAIMGSNSEGKAKIVYQSERSSAPAMKVYQKHKPLTDAELPTLSDVGYTFCGWRDGNGVMAAAGSYSLDKNVTLTAVWTPNHYTIVYHSNTTENEIKDQSADYDKTFRLAANTFNPPTSYDHFAGWSAAPSGSIIYEDEKQVKNLTATDGGVVNLYAVWLDSSSLPIVYHNVEPTDINTSPKSFHADENVTLGTVTRDGYTFLGWYTEENFIHKITGWLPNTYNDAVHLYAKWVLCWRIHYEPNGADVTGDMPDQNINDTESVILRENVYTRPKHIFIGWNTRSDGSGTTYSDKQSFKPTENMTLYAQWHAYRYITFDKNAGDASGTMAVQEVLDGVSAPLTANGFSRVHYTFSRWNTKSDGSGTINTNKANIVVRDGDITLYAQWTPKQYKITYNANKPSLETSAVSGTMTDTSCVYGQTCTVKANSYTLEHYTFKNWNTSKDGSGTTYTVGSAQSLTGNVTLYAQWTPKTYTITYHGDSITPWDGIVTHKTSVGSTTYTNTYSWGSNVDLTNDFVGTYTYQYLTDYWEERDEPTYSTIDIEYTHAGWSVSANSTAKTYNTAQTINDCQLGDADLYALWASDKYYVIYHSNMNIGDRYCYPEDPSSSYAQWTTNDKSNAVYVASSNTSYYTLRNPSGIGDIDDYWTDSHRKFLSWSESPDGCYEYAKESGKAISLSKSKITHLYAVWYYDYSSEYNSHTYNGRTYQAAYVDDFETTVGNFYRVMGYCWIPGTLPDKTKANWDKYPIQATNIFRIFDYCNTLSRLLGYTKCYTQSGTWNGNNATTEMNCNKTNTGYRLPDKDEWYYYASPYGWFPDSNFEYPNGQTVDNFTWYKGNSGNKYHIVGGKGCANFGMYDACGNVSELCHYSDTLVYDYSDKIQYPSTNYHGYYMYVCGGDYSKDADKVKLSSYSLKDNLQNYDTNPDDFARNSDVGFRVMRRM